MRPLPWMLRGVPNGVTFASPHILSAYPLYSYLDITPDVPGVPKLPSNNKSTAVLYFVAFYSGNQLRHDLNSVIGLGNNWNLPVVWALLLRYFSSPVLAVIFSRAYPSLEELSNDPLHVYGFIIAHFFVLWIAAGFIMPRWFGVFIIPERHDDWKQPYAPKILRDTTEGETAASAETASASPPDSSEETKDEPLGDSPRRDAALLAETSPESSR